MVALSKFDICNRALDLVGASVIADFDGGSAESEVAGRTYEGLVEERLTGTMPDGAAIEWRFCMELADLGVPLGDTPADKWAYAYNLPADLLAIRAVRRSDWPVKFDRYGNKLFCDEGADVVIEYTFRQVEASFAPYFRAAIVSELASVFAMSLNRDIELSDYYRKESAGLWAAARFADSKGRTTERVKASRILSARY